MIPIVDADAHTLEDCDRWPRYVDEPYRSQTPRLVKDNRDTLRVMIEGTLYTKPEGYGCSAKFGLSVRPPEYGAAMHLNAMERDGIAVAMLFPTYFIPLYAMHSPELANALCRGWNDMVHEEFAGAHPDRFLHLAAVPHMAPDLAVRELRRCVEQLGAKGVWLPSHPWKERQTLNSPELYPLYEAAQDLNVPVMIHGGAGAGTGAYRFDKQVFTSLTTQPVEMLFASASVIMGGICERFPRLRFSFLEAGAGWVAFWLPRMDEYAAKGVFFDYDFPLSPTEYFKRQCWVSFDPDESNTLRYAIETVGADRLIFSSDYPHLDAPPLGTFRETMDHVLNLAQDDKERICYRNSLALFDLPEEAVWRAAGQLAASAA